VPPDTTNCNTCGALVYRIDVPSKKTGNCWRCEVKRQRKLIVEHTETIKQLVSQVNEQDEEADE